MKTNLWFKAICNVVGSMVHTFSQEICPVLSKFLLVVAVIAAAVYLLMHSFVLYVVFILLCVLIAFIIKEHADLQEQYDEQCAIRERIDKHLAEGIRIILKAEVIPTNVAVELSYLTEEHQQLFVSIFDCAVHSCNYHKACKLRQLEQKGKFTSKKVTKVLLSRS